MRQIPTPTLAPFERLQHEAQRAGLALACPYTCSAEFEAAVIRSRRRAGAYRTLYIRRYTVLAAWLILAAIAGGYLLG